ncbi:UDP-2,3-diacylglucosamine diphosphatase [Algibacter amylolyticus]|uniref:UDP-2,3-diacylglucosamine diphosphatase n=1 Tax=Algibacter amylolyticus TaxID=1608400 RepID=A0A5M7AYI6_9FLAO|nr:UDP-2,3-diacylglucosamine diphosphatase [Algibacter amylolyticus]KAA5821148.1 UDP-2,3-diacylglucosamine diphosphatase [Algibacter amylolyticus]MBB5269793.1 UDP-2,3-diacylglucosamine pyrophosphatase LpxH [Algibacter amylolyticus]TSJ72094.1 UDP-2,3-diacylglucosamine diphosphatase [Algibacter amylolyticus]
MKIKRKVEIAVISDVHLGTYGCHAKHLLTYLNSIEPKKLVLNGDIIDIWQFSKRYFPKSHMKVIKKLMSMASNGVEVIYITGNHDEMLRKFSGTTIGNITIVDKVVLELDGQKAWFFHGDVFDISVQNAKWLAKLGGYGYDLLTLLNRGVNWYLDKRGKERYSLSKRVKNGVKGAVKYINDYEKVISELAIENEYDYVICGHIHQPKMQYFENKHGKTMYLNSGDWVENFTALEYQFKRWKIYNFNKDKLAPFVVLDEDEDLQMKDLIAAITIVDQVEKKKKVKKQ